MMKDMLRAPAKETSVAHGQPPRQLARAVQEQQFRPVSTLNDLINEALSRSFPVEAFNRGMRRIGRQDKRQLQLREAGSWRGRLHCRIDHRTADPSTSRNVKASS